jgi:flagellar assembly protein FliH
MGLAKGHAEAFQRFKEEADVRISRLDQLLTEFEGAKSSIFQANERFLMDMIYRISKMILLRELTTDKQYILRLVSEALNHVGAKEHIHIRVHPRDLETIGLIQDEVRKKLGDVKNIQIDEDPTLESGGCKMETEWSYLDSSVDTQLKRLFDALFTPEVT